MSAPEPRPAWSVPRRPRRLGRLGPVLALALSSAIGLGLGEALVRRFAPQPAFTGAHFYAADPELGWVLRPGADERFAEPGEFDTQVAVDAQGLRASPHAPGRPILLALGDSLVFGWGVEADESYPAVAAALAGFDLANAGVPHYDLCQALELGERLVARVHPAAIVVGVFLGNDEIDAAESRERVAVAGGELTTPTTSRFAALRRGLLHPIFERSQLVRFVRFSPPVAALERRLLGRNSADEIEVERTLAAYRQPVPEEIRAGAERSRACLARFVAARAAPRPELVAALVPGWFELDPDRLARSAARIGARPADFDLDAPRRRFAAELDALGVPSVDPLPELRAAAAADEPLFFTRDPHLTRAGNAIVGRVLARRLGERTNLTVGGDAR